MAIDDIVRYQGLAQYYRSTQRGLCTTLRLEHRKGTGSTSADIVRYQGLAQYVSKYLALPLGSIATGGRPDGVAQGSIEKEPDALPQLDRPDALPQPLKSADVQDWGLTNGAPLPMGRRYR